MYSCAKARRPAKGRIQVHEFGAVGRVGEIGSLRRNAEAPYIARPGTIRLGVIDLVDPPVICCAGDKAVRIRESDEAGNETRGRHVALESVCRSIGHVFEVVAQIHVVRDCMTSRSPRDVDPRGRMQSSVGRSRRRSVRPHLARAFHHTQNLGRRQGPGIEAYITQIATPHLRGIGGISTHAKGIRVDGRSGSAGCGELTITIVCESSPLLYDCEMNPLARGRVIVVNGPVMSTVIVFESC